jgi:hypothetical protein
MKEGTFDRSTSSEFFFQHAISAVHVMDSATKIKEIPFYFAESDQRAQIYTKFRRGNNMQGSLTFLSLCDVRLGDSLIHSRVIYKDQMTFDGVETTY